MDAQLQSLLREQARHFRVLESGKVECTINGHCFPARHDVLSAFVNGPKFQKLVRRSEAEGALTKYDPFIVASQNFPDMLYCALTGQLVDRSLDAVKKHMQGKRFERAKERFTADEQELRPEPTLESLGVRLPPGAPLPGGRRAPEATSGGGDDGEDEAAAAVKGCGKDGAEGEEEPAFWQPSDDEGAAEEGDEEEPGSSGGDKDDAMEEDDAAPARGKKAAAKVVGGGAKMAAAAATGKGKAARASGGGGGAAAAAAAAAAKASKKKNVSKPSASKKARR